MDHHDQDPTPPPQPQPQPEPRRRRRRPNGRWTNPATPLQAARFALRKGGKEVITAIRHICPGHSGEPCKIDVAKLSDYETGNRRPGLNHIEAFCRYYQKSPETLGLIKWRDDPGQENDSENAPDPARAHVVVISVHAHPHTLAATVASEILRMLAQHSPATASTPATSAEAEDDPAPDPSDP